MAPSPQVSGLGADTAPSLQDQGYSRARQMAAVIAACSKELLLCSKEFWENKYSYTKSFFLGLYDSPYFSSEWKKMCSTLCFAAWLIYL
jgi:hypothetical protein